MKTVWSTRYADRTRMMKGSAVRELLKITQQPDIISFGGGLPAPEAFPTAEFEEASNRVLREHGAQALQYSATEGYLPLREMIARRMGALGGEVEARNVLITTGSQQALDLIGKVFINPGDLVLVERPTYLGALQAWNAYEAQYITLSVDEAGMKMDALELALRVNPKFIYALPNFQNPTGVTLSFDRRRKLIDCAARFEIPILEDDPYGQLRYEGAHIPSLFVMGAKACKSSPKAGNVIYLSTFSKILAPGLRLGWIVAPEEVIECLVLAKQGSDLHTSTFDQMVAYELAHGDFLEGHIQRIRMMYRERRDAMLSALSRHFPENARWTKPEGGLFLWVYLPSILNAKELLSQAIQEKVAFVPGTPFYAERPEHDTLRLNYSNATPEKIEEGIRRLGLVIRRMLPSASKKQPIVRET